MVRPAATRYYLRSTTNADSPDCRDNDANLNTALHRAVLSVCGNGKNRADSYRQLDMLMSSQNIKLNMPNKEGYTAIGFAVEYPHKNCVEHILRHSSADRLHLDYYPGDSESTVRDIIKEIYPELQPLLPAPLMQSLDSSDGDKKLLAALQHNRYDIFKENLVSGNPNPWYDEPYHSSLL